MPRSYSMDFRLQVVTAALTENVTQREIAQRFKISEATVHNWIKQHTRQNAAKVTEGERTPDPMPDIRKRLQELEQENIVLRQVAQYLTDGVPPKAMYPLVHEIATAQSDQRVPVVVTCRILGFSPQAYYQWRRSPLSDRERTNREIVGAMRQIKRDLPDAGYRIVNEELRSQGVHISDRRAWRLYSEHDLWSEPEPSPPVQASGPYVATPIISRSQAPHDLNANSQCSWLVLQDSPKVTTQTGDLDSRRSRSPLEVAFVIDARSLRIRGVGVARASSSAAVAQALREACGIDVPRELTIHVANPNWAQHPHVVKSLSCIDVVVSSLSSAEAAAIHTGKTIQRAVRAGLQRTQLTRIDQFRDALRQWVCDIYHQTRNEKYLWGLTPLEFEALTPGLVQVGA